MHPAADLGSGETLEAHASSTWARALAGATNALLVLIIAAGALARIVALPGYVPDSGDEWGNTMAPFRVLYEGGDPNLFLHPSLYYDVTAAAYAAVFNVARAAGFVGRTMSMTDVFISDQRYFVFAARGVSVLGALLTMWALYGLGQALWNRQAGLFAAALLAVYPLHAVYSDAVRVDSLFLAVFIYAFSRIVRVLADPAVHTSDIAGLFTGLAVSANYNGGLLVGWLIAAHILSNAGATSPADTLRRLARALALTALGFIVTSPFILLNPGTFLVNFGFISGLSTSEHPGMEGRGVTFYAEEVLRMNPVLCGAIAAGAVAILLLGTRRERFVLSLPVGYFLVFSLLRTKFDRFILPAMALFFVVASGLPPVLARRASAQRTIAGVTYGLTASLLFLCITAMAPRAIPVPRHQMLARPDAPLFDWIERAVPPRSNILVESGIVQLSDTLKEPGRFAAELRASMVRVRPNLDQQFVGTTYVGGHANYEPGILAAKQIDYAIISPRNVRYIESQCAAFPDVCAFYGELRARGRVAFETPDGFEPAIVYQIPR